jgi:hypothetical protein
MAKKLRYTISCRYSVIGAEGEYAFKTNSVTAAISQAKNAFIEHCNLAAAINIPSRAEVETKVVGISG